MKYPYLAEEGKAKSLSLILLVCSAICSLLALFVTNLSTVMTWLAAILAAVLFGFSMLYLDTHNVQGQSIKKYVLAFHFFAIHALMVAFAQLTGEPGSLSHNVVWGLADAALMACLLGLAKVFKPFISNALIAVCACVAFVLTLVGADVLSNIIFIVAGVVLALFAFNKSIMSALLGCLITLLAVLGLFGKNTMDMHGFMHYIGLILMMLAARSFYDVVSPDIVNNDVNLDVNRNNVSASTTRSSLGTADTTRTSVDTAAATRLAGTDKKTSDKKADRTSRSTILFGDYEFDRSWFIAEYKDLPYADLLNAPVYAFKGVSEAMAEDLRKAFGIKTIGQLADSKYFAWAKEIVEEANK